MTVATIKRLSNKDVLALLHRRKDFKQGESYSLERTLAPFGLDVLISDEEGYDEGEMSFVLPYADGNRRDGVGDLLEVNESSIVCDRHRSNAIILFDHGKEVTLPIGMAHPRNEKGVYDRTIYTNKIDPIAKRATDVCYVYQGRLPIPGMDRKKNYDHALYAEQIFDMRAKGILNSGSIGYSVIDASHLPPDYERGIPQGMHLRKVKKLESSLVVLPANQDTASKSIVEPLNDFLCKGRCCGKQFSPYLVKGFSPYVIKPKGQLGWEPRWESKAMNLRHKYRHKDHCCENCKDGKPCTASKAQPSDKISPAKARQILKDGEANGEPLTDKQRAMFGAAAGRDKALEEDREAKCSKYLKRLSQLTGQKMDTLHPGQDDYASIEGTDMTRAKQASMWDEQSGKGIKSGSHEGEECQQGWTTRTGCTPKQGGSEPPVTTSGHVRTGHRIVGVDYAFQQGDRAKTRRIILNRDGSVFAHSGDPVKVTQVDGHRITVQNRAGQTYQGTDSVDFRKSLPTNTKAIDTNTFKQILQRLRPGESKTVGGVKVERGRESSDERFADRSNSFRVGDGEWMTQDSAADHLNNRSKVSSGSSGGSAAGQACQQGQTAKTSGCQPQTKSLRDPTGRERASLSPATLANSELGTEIPTSTYKDLKAIRTKYRASKGRLRRLRKSKQGHSVIRVRSKDVDALRRDAEQHGVSLKWMSSEKGIDRVKLSGDDAAIEKCAKLHGRF